MSAIRLPSLFIRRRRATLLKLVLNGMTQGVLAISGAWLVMSIFDGLGKQADHAAWWFAGLALIVVSGVMLRRTERVHAEWLGQNYAASIRRRLYKRLLFSDQRTLQRRRTGGLLLKFVGDLSALRRWVSLGMARLLVAGVATLIAMAALAWLHWPFFVAVLTVLSVSAAWIVYQGGTLREAIAESRRCQANISSNVTEKLHNLSTVQAFGQAEREQKVLRRQSDRLLRASVGKAAKIGTLRGVIEAAAGACVLAVLLMAYLFPPPDLTAGMVAAVVSIIGFLTPPLRDLGRAHEYWLGAEVAKDNLRSVMRGAVRVRDRRDSVPLNIDRAEIQLDDVSVSGVFDAVNVHIRNGCKILLSGANGSGKSTLLGLIGRLFDPDKGRILIDGQDIAGVRMASLRRQVAFVSSDIPLLRGTLKKNLCYGAETDLCDDVAAVIERFDCGDVFNRLPDGLDTRIAEGGSNLSQGERLQISLVRALLRRPRILLLDEADANLDSDAVETLERVIERFEGTLIMASHRRRNLHLFDEQWLLKGGAIVSAATSSNVSHLHKGRAREVPGDEAPSTMSGADAGRSVADHDVERDRYA